MPKYIDLYHTNRPEEEHHGFHVSSLAIYPNSLQVIGDIPHCETLEPRSIKDANLLINWLEKWKTKKEKTKS